MSGNAEKRYAGLTYEQAVRRYADTVTRVCLMRVNNYADAEDCFQNVFVKLCYKAPDFESEEHLKAWLIRVSIRECVSYLRQNRSILSLDAAPEPSVPFDREAADMSWALMKTPPGYREVLYLHYCEQYTVAEIGRILGKNENTVKSLLKRGREKLRSVYGGEPLD